MNPRSIHPDYRKAIEGVMAEAGITGFRYEYGSKHPRVVWPTETGEAFMPLPWTPSDAYRGAQKAASQLRHRVGLLERPERVTSVPHKYRRRKTAAKRTVRPPQPIAPVKPDPFEVLEGLKVRPRMTIASNEGHSEPMPSALPRASLFRRIVARIRRLFAC